MIERLRMSQTPLLFHLLPPEGASMSTLDFLDEMQLLLVNAHGMAGCAYAAACNPEAAGEDVAQTLFVLNEYLQGSRVLFARWRDTQCPAQTVEEEESEDVAF